MEPPNRALLGTFASALSHPQHSDQSRYRESKTGSDQTYLLWEKIVRICVIPCLTEISRDERASIDPQVRPTQRQPPPTCRRSRIEGPEQSTNQEIFKKVVYPRYPTHRRYRHIETVHFGDCLELGQAAAKWHDHSRVNHLCVDFGMRHQIRGKQIHRKMQMSANQSRPGARRLSRKQRLKVLIPKVQVDQWLGTA